MLIDIELNPVIRILLIFSASIVYGLVFSVIFGYVHKLRQVATKRTKTDDFLRWLQVTAVLIILDHIFISLLLISPTTADVRIVLRLLPKPLLLWAMWRLFRISLSES